MVAKLINLFRIAVLATVIVSICLTQGYSLTIKALLIAGIFTLNLNDFFRARYFRKKKRQVFTLSLIISMLGAGVYYYLLHDAAVSAYFVFSLAEIFVHSTDFPYVLTLFNFLIFLAANVRILKSQLGIAVLSYCFIVMILFFFRYSNLESKKEKLLNQELQDVNAKLKRYSAEIQNITRMEERTRIAQELHDSIGHGLVALGMNLEFAESMIQTDSSKAVEAVRRARSQSKKCMEDLRKAVTALRSDSSARTFELQNSLKELFGRFQPESVKFQLSFDNCVEYETPEIKNCIYKTVREAVTNGIRHGIASLFDIGIEKKESVITVFVKDNGKGCASIVKSDGLYGIEKRVALFGGNVRYRSEPSNGFCLEAIIPSKQQDGEESDD